MSTAWKALHRRYRVKGSRTAPALGVTQEDEDTLRLCDTLVVNDLNEEYYYSQNDIALDAFEAHLRIVDKDPKKYVAIASLMRPVMLEAHKVITALYMWTRNIDKKLAMELVDEVRPSWRMTFFYAIKSAPNYAKIKGGWNRTLRALIRETMHESSPFIIMKYPAKFRPLVAKAHLREDEKTAWLFKKRQASARRDLAAIPEYQSYFQLVEAVRSEDRVRIRETLDSSKLPYTVALGILGKWNREPDMARALVGLMTPWELILAFRKLEKTSLDMSDPGLLDSIMRKLDAEKLQRMKVDPVELFQAYNSVQNETVRKTLAQLVNLQIRTIGESLKRWLEDKRVCVVFDCSGSMETVSEWSIMLAYAIGKNVPEARAIVFSEQSYELHLSGDPLEGPSQLKSPNSGLQLWQSTALGRALLHALQYRPDIIFFISDFEGNVEPWSDKVYEEYKKNYGSFPAVISIKATSSPWTVVGETDALRTGRWLGVPEEYMFTIRNLWDLPTILEYLFKLLPLLKQRGLIEKVPAYVA